MEIEISLTDLLFWPLTLPANGFVFILQQIRDAADREMDDPQVMQQRLVELQLLYELGEVSQSEYDARWTELSGRLTALGTEHILTE